MSDIIATVQEVGVTAGVVLREIGTTTAFTNVVVPAPPALVADLGDVDVTALSNGAVLVYRDNTKKWTSTTNLDAQNMDGGHF